jgi:hypothetical protein
MSRHATGTPPGAGRLFALGTMQTAADLYEAAMATDLLSIGGFLKAAPVEEGGRRLLYIEASNEARDYQGEVILAKALEASADYYLKYGNLDLDHVTVTGPRKGPPDYALYEVGRPIAVEANRGRTFVKAELFQGDAPVAANANAVWDSLTRISPPQRWFPSVGGAVLDRKEVIGDQGDKRVVVTKVRWTNIGLSKTPVNLTVPTVSTMPLGAFAKAWDGAGLDLLKALQMSGGGTDAAALSGGPALQRQSLDRKVQRTVQSYHAFREHAAGSIRAGKAGMSARALARLAQDEGADPDTASEWAERMLADLARGRSTTTKEKSP